MLNCQILNTNVKINNVTTTKEREKNAEFEYN